MIGFCYAAPVKDIEPEPLNVPGNAVEEIQDNQTSDLETAEFKHVGFGPKVLVINKGYGGHGYGGCGCGGYGHSHHHRHYGKKK